jgi:tetratricopeptide (TPR) repeat protein
MMANPRKKQKTNWMLHHLTLIAAVCTILSSAAVFMQFIYPVLRENYRKKALEITSQSAVGDDEVLILVSEFEHLGSYRFNITGRIVETLQKDLRNFPDVRIFIYPNTIPSDDPEQVGAIGRQYKASMLVWGSYDDAGIRPVFAVPRTLAAEFDASDRRAVLERKTAGIIGLYRSGGEGSDSAGEGLVFDDFPSETASMQDFVRGLLPRQIEYLATLYIGVRYYEIGEWDASIAALDRCIAISGPASMSLGLAQAYGRRGGIRLTKGDWTGAAGDLTKSIELDPGNPKTRIDRAYARFMGAAADSAGADCDAAWEILGRTGSSPAIAGRDSVLLNRLSGITIARQGKNDTAFPRLEKGCADGSSADRRVLAPALAELGILLNSRRNYTEAERVLRRSIFEDSTAAIPHYWLGMLSLEIHRDTSAACAYFRKYGALESDTSAVSRMKEKVKRLNCPF